MRSRNSKILFGIILGAIVVSAPIILMLLPQSQSEISVSLLINDGVMIEANGIRIFIDPLFLPSNYSDMPADLILITHAHGDHYSPLDIDIVYTNDTLFVCPENMTEAIDRYDGFGVNPGDTFLFGDINITAFPLYLPDYPSGVPSAHPRESNWTSFIIDINGFTIFHAGDNKYIDEYEQLTDKIDLAFLPIYFDPGLGALNESLLPIVDAINTIRPRSIILTHYIGAIRETFISEYSILVDDSECEILDIEYWTDLIF